MCRRSFISRCRCPRSLSVLLALLWRESGESELTVVPKLSMRWGVLFAVSERVGDEGVELVPEDDVLLLPRSLCVLSGSIMLAPSSHHGHSFVRDSQPSSLSFSGQFWRLLDVLQDRTSWYQRCAQGCVETCRPATHMMVVVELNDQVYEWIVVEDCRFGAWEWC